MNTKHKKSDKLYRIHIFSRYGAISFKDLIDKNIFTKREIKKSIKNLISLIYYIYTSDGIRYKVSKNIFDYATKLTDITSENIKNKLNTTIK